MKITRYSRNARMSQAVVHNGTVYLAGQVPDDANASIEEQTRQVLAKIDDVLKKVGSGKSRLLTAQVYLADISDFNRMNAVWEKWVDQLEPPARTTVQAKLANPAFRIEVTVVAALAEGVRFGDTDTSY